MEQKQPSAYQQGEWSKRFDKLPHHYEPIPNSKGGITPYVERKATLKFISQALQQTREDTIKEIKHFSDNTEFESNKAYVEFEEMVDKLLTKLNNIK